MSSICLVKTFEFLKERASLAMLLNTVDLAKFRSHSVSRQECERQQCERHQCEANSANANSAKGSTVRMPTVRMRQRCECQQCECDSSAKDDSPNCAKPIGLSFFFLVQKLLLLFTSIFDLKLPITARVSIYQEM